MDICVIVPTIREYEYMRAHFDNARAYGFDLDRLFILLMTEGLCDIEGMTSMLGDKGVSGAAFDGTAHEERYDDHDIPEYSCLVLAASHAQASLGLLYIWVRPEFDYGVFIGDNTLPYDEWDFSGRHVANLDRTDKVESMLSDERWVSALYQNADEHRLYSRGYPYFVMDETVETGTRGLRDVVASQGLQTNVPSPDAARILMDSNLEGQAQTRTDFDDFDDDFVIESRQYLTVCSMNLAFECKVIPALYQLPMDGNEWEAGRFDDIWSGMLLKRTADVLGKDTVTDYSLCEHNEVARPTLDDPNDEIPGLEPNKRLQEVIDVADGDVDDHAGIFEAMVDALVDGDWSDYRNGDFSNYVSEHIRGWLDCLDAFVASWAAAPADD